MTMLPLYAHVQTRTDAHYAEHSVRGGEEAMMSLDLITAPPKRCRHYHHTEAVFPQKKEKETLDAAPSVIVNHDSVFSPTLPERSYLRQGKEAYSQGKMASGDGRACVPGIPQQTVDTLL